MNRSTYKNKRVVWIFRLLFLVTSFGTLSSCATFSKTVENPTRLHRDNFELVNGTCSISSTQSDSIEKATGYKHWYHHNFLEEIDRKLIKDTLVIDTTSTYAVRLQMKNPKVLKIDYIVNDKVFRERSLKAKITKDGYVKLKNKNTQLLLIPYVFGALDLKRARLTVDEEQNLIFDVGGDLSGGILIVMIGGNSYHYRKTYNRISATTKTVNQ